MIRRHFLAFLGALALTPLGRSWFRRAVEPEHVQTGDTLTIGDRTYTFVTRTRGWPCEVAIGADVQETYRNFAAVALGDFNVTKVDRDGIHVGATRIGIGEQP